MMDVTVDEAMVRVQWFTRGNPLHGKENFEKRKGVLSHNSAIESTFYAFLCTKEYGHCTP